MIGIGNGYEHPSDGVDHQDETKQNNDMSKTTTKQWYSTSEERTAKKQSYKLWWSALTPKTT